MYPQNELQHYGVLGMKWGVRKDDRPEGVSRSVNRDAKRDAKEFTRAKLFYGETAGTRRKLIKARVEAKSKRDPAYKKAFDHHVEKTDLGKRASQAKSERKRKDVVKGTAKTARGVKNLILKNGAPVGVAALGIYYMSKDPRVRAAASRASKVAYSKIKDGQATIRTAIFLRKFGVKL